MATQIEYSEAKRSAGGAWFVVESSDFGKVYIWILEPTDKTWIGFDSRRAYDSRCPCCFLGHAHSRALHDQRVREAERHNIAG